MKIAAIDLGTNSFKLLIGEVTQKSYRFLCEEKAYVQIGKESLLHEQLTLAAQQRTIAALMDFKRMIDAYAVAYVQAKATSTMRNARNAAVVMQQIKAKTGIAVEIISGEEEAELIYQGVKEAIEFKQENVLIMDIGGGSVEFIICNAQQKLWQQSFEIGAQRLLDTFHYHDPILPQELAALRHYCAETLQPLLKATALYRPSRLVGTSGAFRTLLKIHKMKCNIGTKHHATACNLPLDQFAAIYDALLPMSHEERTKIPGLGTTRVDMIVVSATLIHFVISHTPITRMDISAYALKVGIFLTAWKDLQQKGML